MFYLTISSPVNLVIVSMLVFESAGELVRSIAERDVSVQEVMAAHLDQIERVNPKVNAICTLVADQAMGQAREADRALARGRNPGPLYGLPIAIKDLTPTKGIRTTYGSPIYQDNVPGEDTLFVERLKHAGAIVIGKTNTPEFGAGSHTFNRVFGATRNPYDLDKTAGGSSGGAAVALACGMIPLADGSDLGGSVRNPAGFNNVVGLRPSPGRIPRYPRDEAWDTLAVVGPMARTVGDVALMLSVMSGPDTRDPISIAETPSYAGDLNGMDLAGTRVAWSKDLGQFPVQRIITDVIERALPSFADMGCTVSEDYPDCSGAAEIFHTLRAQSFAAGHAGDLRKHRDLIKETVIWNTERGLELSAEDVSRAQTERAALYHRFREFFERYDFLLLPVSQVTPFPVETEWVREIEGVKMETYIDWMKTCSLITLTGHPAMSVPCGFTADGLPVGIQIVGRHRGEEELLKFAHSFEQVMDLRGRHPKIAL